MPTPRKNKAITTKTAKLLSRKLRPGSDVLVVFSRIFNEALDTKNVPQLNYGRQIWVAERYKVSKSAARNWCNGTNLPDAENLMLIADDLGMSIDELMGRKPISSSRKFVKIPFKDSTKQNQITGEVSFEENILASTMRTSMNGLEMHPVMNDAMAPLINVGDVAFVDTLAKHLEDNKIFMFVTSDKRVLFRRVIKSLEEDSYDLIAQNKDIPVIKVQRSKIKIGDAQGDFILALVGEISWTIKKVGNSSGHLQQPPLA